MGNSVDKLLDIFGRNSWERSSRPSSFITTRADLSEQMSIVPEPEPTLRIEYKSLDGSIHVIKSMNLAAVDAFVAKLIKMRDTLDALTPKLEDQP